MPQITYVISDGTLIASSTLDILVDSVNDAPETQPDTNTTLEDVDLLVFGTNGLLANDADPEGVNLTLTKFTVGGMTYPAGTKATIPEGEITINADGSYLFSPAENFNGSVQQITYVAVCAMTEA